MMVFSKDLTLAIPQTIYFGLGHLVPWTVLARTLGPFIYHELVVHRPVLTSASGFTHKKINGFFFT